MSYYQKKVNWYIRRMAGGSKSFYRSLVRRWAGLILVPFSRSQRSNRSQCACPLGCLDLLPDGKLRVYCIEDLIRIAESVHYLHTEAERTIRGDSIELALIVMIAVMCLHSEVLQTKEPLAVLAFKREKVKPKTR